MRGRLIAAVSAILFSAFSFIPSQAATPELTQASPLHVLLMPNAVSRNFEAKCSPYWGANLATTLPEAFGKIQPYALCGYAGNDFRRVYGVPAKYNGAGESVGVVDAYVSPTLRQDVNTYSAAHGLPVMSRRQLSVLPASSYDLTDVCDSSGWDVEETLDVEAIHAMAPAARIIVSAGTDCGMVALDAANLRLVKSGLVHQISNSYEMPVDAEYIPHFLVIQAERIYRLAIRKHVGEYFATGDNGSTASDDAGQPITSPTYPSTSPHVTAVGGTALLNNADGSYRQELPWSSAESWRVKTNGGVIWSPVPGLWIWGTGGGQSQYFLQPKYQRNVVASDISHLYYGPGIDPQVRTTPDVGMDADPATGMLIGVTQQWPDGQTYYGETVIGGTSLATPLMAGYAALLDQKHHKHLGFLNPWLYRLPSSAFHDVPGSLSPVAAVAPDPTETTHWDGLFTLGIPTAYSPRSGYDLLTGRGSLDSSFVLGGV